jgi:predicted ATPase with chaperone activity
MHLPAFQPKIAQNTEATGLPRGFLFELVVKHSFTEGTATLQQLSRETKLDYGVIQTVFRNMQQEQLCETKGMVGMDFEFTLTTKGMQAADAAFRKNPYAGPAPAPLASYCRAVREQAFHPKVTRQSLAHYLGDLVVTEELIGEIGASIMTGGSLFLYGPTGNGKTSIALRLHRVFQDYVYIPYAVEVSSQVLSVYDPIVHKPADKQPPEIDPRWVLCERPFLSVGGEMRADMLEPRVDESTRLIIAPLQMKANNGILVIDDFGRQAMKPVELLNRWIVPLDRRLDYLALTSGVQFEIPFELMVVFATNLELKDLAEEAFIRRIKNKVRIETVAPAVFTEILRRVCEEKGIQMSWENAEYTCQKCTERALNGLRACFPRDLVDILCGVAAFEQRAPTLDRADVDNAMKIYFTA